MTFAPFSEMIPLLRPIGPTSFRFQRAQSLPE